jgi:hypothetical protein
MGTVWAIPGCSGTVLVCSDRDVFYSFGHAERLPNHCSITARMP